LNREQARDEAEEYLSRATDMLDYSDVTYAKRGLNLAWLERPEEADELLQDALKYASRSDVTEVFDIVRTAYEVMENEERLEELEELTAEIRKRQLEAAIAQQEAQAAQQQQAAGEAEEPESSPDGQPAEEQDTTPADGE
jgi:hypothetical protein